MITGISFECTLTNLVTSISHNTHGPIPKTLPPKDSILPSWNSHPFCCDFEEPGSMRRRTIGLGTSTASLGTEFERFISWLLDYTLIFVNLEFWMSCWWNTEIKWLWELGPFLLIWLVIVYLFSGVYLFSVSISELEKLHCVSETNF